MKHVWVTHENCTRTYCGVCEGGLSICSVCRLLEGSLTTDCPGVDVYLEYSSDVYMGLIDYRDGEWRPGECSPSSTGSALGRKV